MISFNCDNIGTLCEKYNLNDRQIVAYGHSNCITHNGRAIGYEDARMALIMQGKNVSTYSLAFPKTDAKYKKIKLNSVMPKEVCKAALVNVIIRNYKRHSKGKKIIPVIFFIGSKQGDYQLTSLQVCEPKTARITDAELRRCYKLINLKETLLKFQFSIDLEKIQLLEEIAKKTFHAMTIDLTADNSLEFNEISLVWKSDDWNEAWEQRQSSKDQSKVKIEKAFPWRKELLENILCEDNLSQTSQEELKQLTDTV